MSGPAPQGFTVSQCWSRPNLVVVGLRGWSMGAVSESLHFMAFSCHNILSIPSSIMSRLYCFELAVLHRVRCTQRHLSSLARSLFFIEMWERGVYVTCATQMPPHIHALSRGSGYPALVFRPQFIGGSNSTNMRATNKIGLLVSPYRFYRHLCVFFMFLNHKLMRAATHGRRHTWMV